MNTSKDLPFSENDYGESVLESGQMKTLYKLEQLMDSAIEFPGGFRLGLDPLLGLIPVVGDAAGALISLYFVYSARRMGASSRLQRKMLGRILIDALVGCIPIGGDIFDAIYKVNDRNMRSLEARARSGRLVNTDRPG